MSNFVYVLKSVDINGFDIEGVKIDRNTLSISASSWLPDANLTNGIKGVLWGVSRDGSLLSGDVLHSYVVLQVEAGAGNLVRASGGIVKFKDGKVVHYGTAESANAWLIENISRRLSQLTQDAKDLDTTKIAASSLTVKEPGELVKTECFFGRALACGLHSIAASLGASGESMVTGEESVAISTGKNCKSLSLKPRSFSISLGSNGIATNAAEGSVAISLGTGGAVIGALDGAVVGAYIDEAGKRRIAVGYIGENGLEAGVAYRCINGRFIAGDSLAAEESLAVA